jgi:hypothetical protein
LAVWHYCDDSARIIFSPSHGDDLEAKIVHVVRERPGITKTELRNAIDRKLAASTLAKALTWLVGRGDIVERAETTTGRPITRYCPRTTEATTEATWALKSEEFYGKCSTTPTGTITKTLSALADAAFRERFNTPVEPATLTELLDWRNAHGCGFVRRADGVIWVTNEDELTPELREAIVAQQETLAVFVPSTPTEMTTRPNPEATTRPNLEAITPPPTKSRGMTPEEFFAKTNAMRGGTETKDTYAYARESDRQRRAAAMAKGETWHVFGDDGKLHPIDWTRYHPDGTLKETA